MPSPFENALDRFQFGLMESWYNLHKQEIGLSIQKFDYIQDASDPTRISCGVSSAGPVHSATKFINSHCARIQTEHLDRCNKLDAVLKKQASANPGFSRASITCRCHAGVSNVLIPYRHPKEKDTKKVWYIFVGQFLLREEASPDHTQFMRHLLKERFFHPLLQKHITQEESPYVKPEIFIPENIYNVDFDGATRKGHISYISAIDVIAFQESVLASFETFLNHSYESAEGIAQISEYFSTTKPGQRLYQRAEEFHKWFNGLYEAPSFSEELKVYVESVRGLAYNDKANDLLAGKLIAWFDNGQFQKKIQDAGWFAERPLLDSPNGESAVIGGKKPSGGFLRKIFGSGA
jgi:hypothetical protein